MVAYIKMQLKYLGARSRSFAHNITSVHFDLLILDLACMYLTWKYSPTLLHRYLVCFILNKWNQLCVGTNVTCIMTLLWIATEEYRSLFWDKIYFWITTYFHKTIYFWKSCTFSSFACTDFVAFKWILCIHVFCFLVYKQPISSYKGAKYYILFISSQQMWLPPVGGHWN
jgi:hypothetical protein